MFTMLKDFKGNKTCLHTIIRTVFQLMKRSKLLEVADHEVQNQEEERNKFRYSCHVKTEERASQV